MIPPGFWWIGSSVCFSMVEREGGTNTPDVRTRPTSSCSRQTNGTRKRACEKFMNFLVKVLVSQLSPTLCHPMDCFRETTESRVSWFVGTSQQPGAKGACPAAASPLFKILGRGRDSEPGPRVAAGEGRVFLLLMETPGVHPARPLEPFPSQPPSVYRWLRDLGQRGLWCFSEETLGTRAGGRPGQSSFTFKQRVPAKCELPGSGVSEANKVWSLLFRGWACRRRGSHEPRSRGTHLFRRVSGQWPAVTVETSALPLGNRGPGAKLLSWALGPGRPPPGCPTLLVWSPLPQTTSLDSALPAAVLLRDSAHLPGQPCLS